MQNHVTAAPAGAVRITGDHGYRIEGDTVFLNAELALVDGIAATGWALQLWACDNPHSSGPMVGIKVAEAPVVLDPGDARPCRLEVATFAALPAQRRDYAMVLVLASGAPGAFEQIHDFANYPVRQSFDVPYLGGALRYTIEGNRVVLSAGRVTNPRSFGTSSGTLALELWATSAPHADGAVMDGQLLARVVLGELAGQGTFEQVELRTDFTPPLVGEWNIAFVLSEWTLAAGYVVRDFCNFAMPLRRAAAASDPTEPDGLVARPSAAPQQNGAPAEHRAEPERPAPTLRRRPSYEEIALAAYYRFLARGDRPGSAEADWFGAERELATLG